VVIDRTRLQRAFAQELETFRLRNPRSAALFERSRGSLLGGVPMSWMGQWASSSPLFVDEASGARIRDVDGHTYLDLCLGDTGAMTGHAPAPAVEALAAQARRGLTFMLPTEDAAWVGEELARRFGVPYWQFAMTATDANRFVLRLARAVTGRPRILVFNWCYHGTVDETLVLLQDGAVVPRSGTLGPPVDPSLTTAVVEFNDLPALERALGGGDIACVLAEPALTNIGIVHPDPGFHEALRRITRATGTLLAIDETHTLCAGPGGFTAAHGLEPDFVVVGKPIASGLPTAAYGCTGEVALRIARASSGNADTTGVGGTLAGNALSMAVIRATLTHVLTEEAYRRTIPLAERFARGVRGVIERYALPWNVTSLGSRAEYWFRAVPARNGTEAAEASDPELDRYMHLAALNRGVLLTPFHNMALVAPQVAEADIDAHTAAFEESVAALVGWRV
jgi:glutamate-1-semialdehyde 2,1-aminomutase